MFGLPSWVTTFGILFLVIVAGIIMSSLRDRGRQGEWEAFAQSNGLAFRHGGIFSRPIMEGVFRGHQVELTTYTETVEHGDDSTTRTYTRISVTVKINADQRLRISQSHLLNKLGEALGMHDVKIGQDKFDSRFVIESIPPEFASLILGGDPILQESIIEIATFKSDFTLTLNNQTLMVTYYGFLSDNTKMEHVLGTLCDFADKVETSH